ncbi:uncharacterized protein L201_000314 [Kwoniella dendrophila CBS 6074]|uniref:Kinetochore protein Spc24 n=1 Tax=Kwoniella dendrophila CBS 6074 TaxID=1295534 RepID=A0AAX4JJ34_9TREE
MAEELMTSTQYRELDSPERTFNEHNESQDLSESIWRSIAQIVREVGPTLSPDDELGDLAAAEEAVIAKDQERAAIQDKIQEELRQLSRQLTQATTAAQRPPSHPSALEHESQVRSLEQQQYTIGKQLNEEQSSISKKEIELSKLKLEKEEIDKYQVDQDGNSNDDDWINGKVIRLKMLSDAGFKLVTPKDNKGPNKILIRNDKKNDVHSVSIDNTRSKVYTANLIWSLASEGC